LIDSFVENGESDPFVGLVEFVPVQPMRRPRVAEIWTYLIWDIGGGDYA